MGEVRCDILTGENMTCVFVRFVDTTYDKIQSFRAPTRFTPEELSISVTHVMFYGGTLPTFPSEIAKFFPNVKFIDIYDCGLKVVHKSDLTDFKNLERLRLDSNRITFLPGNLFEDVPKLTHFSIARNRLSKIGNEIFNSERFEKNLKEANFSKNSEIDYCFNRETNRGSLLELRMIINRDCRILESLEQLAERAVQKGVNKWNVEDVLFIASQLNLDKLKGTVECFKKLVIKYED